MANPLTYQSLKCVLEHLEANKRIHISSRCPVLRKIERKIPLHLNLLSFGYSTIIINDITYKICTRQHRSLKDPKIEGDYKNYVVSFPLDQLGRFDGSADNLLMPGDIPMNINEFITQEIVRSDEWRESRSQYPLHILFKKDSMDLDRVLPSQLVEFHVAMKQLTVFLLGSRCEVQVNQMKVDIVKYLSTNLKVLRLPVNIKFEVQELEVKSAHLPFLVPILNSSTRLKELKMHKSFFDDQSFQLPIVQNAQKLWIGGNNEEGTLWNETLLKLSNINEITLNCTMLSEMELMNFVQGILNEGREIGTRYIFDSGQWGVLLNLLEMIGEQYERKLTKEWRNRTSLFEYSILFSISLPMNSTSELLIHGTVDHFKSHTRMEVVPITPVEQAPWDRVIGFIFTTFSRIIGRFR